MEFDAPEDSIPNDISRCLGHLIGLLNASTSLKEVPFVGLVPWTTWITCAVLELVLRHLARSTSLQMVHSDPLGIFVTFLLTMGQYRECLAVTLLTILTQGELSLEVARHKVLSCVALNRPATCMKLSSLLFRGLLLLSNVLTKQGVLPLLISLALALAMYTSEQMACLCLVHRSWTTLLVRSFRAPRELGVTWTPHAGQWNMDTDHDSPLMALFE